ncbi:hypothetical protein [Streptomyces sp. NPDC101132]|uniref:hypothetical protein n=1 Tax=Streptomyces sp. NPDC101132 TaxID=3366110 RepID=UPI0038112CF5
MRRMAWRDEQAREDARHWLTEDGVVQVAEDAWTDGGTPDGRLTANQVAHEWAELALTDERFSAAEQVRLAFGLLDLLDDYRVAWEFHLVDRGPHGPLPTGPLWEGYRRRLEGTEAAEAVTYSLWVDWFEDRATSATAFHEVLGRDAGRLADGTAGPGLLNRARHVLECSGPVPWPVKEAAYEAAALVPELHPAVFRGILTSYHDLYGDLRPAPALALLSRLSLPEDTRHLAPLRTALAAGHTSHHRNPEAWPES